MVRRLAILPPAPVLVGGLARRIPPGLTEVLAACDEAVTAVVAGEHEVQVLAAAPDPRDLAWRPDGQRAVLPGDAAALLSGDGPAVGPPGWLVADHLLDRAGYGGVRHRRLPGGPDRDRCASLLVMADGSAARGERSPRVGAPGAPFDAALEHAVRDCDPAVLATIDDTSAARVGCGTAAVWRELAHLTAADRWTCASLRVLAPLGVTYVVAWWRVSSGDDGS